MAAALQRRDFRMLLGGQFVSDYGRQLSIFALPTIAILSLHASAITVTAINGVEWAVIPLLAMVAGVLIDRWKRRRTMVIANLVRLLALSSIPVAALLHVLTIPQLFCTAFIVSLASLFFDTAYQPFLAFLVGREAYAEGNARMTMSFCIASALGNGSGGPIVQMLGAPLAIVANLMTYLTGTMALLSIRQPEMRTEADSERSFRREFREGAAIVWGDPFLRGLAFTSGTFYFGGALVDAVLPLYVYRSLHQTPLFFGVILALASAGIFGSAMATKLAQKRGALTLVPFAIAAVALGHAICTLAVLPILAILAGRTLIACAAPTYDVMVQTIATERTADTQLGRMNAAMRTITNAPIPVACTLGGVLSGVVGFHGAMLFGALACAGSLGVFFALRAQTGRNSTCLSSTTQTYAMRSAA